MEIIVRIDDQDEINVLTEIALANKVNSVDYVNTMVRTFLQGQVKGKYMESLYALSAPKLKEVLGKTYTEIKAQAIEANKVKEEK